MNSEAVVVICHSNEIWVPRERLVAEGLFQGLPERIELPYWVTFDLFSVFIAFLNKEQLRAHRPADLEGLLLLAGLVGWESFGVAVAKQVIEPSINPGSCIELLKSISRVKAKGTRAAWITALLRTIMGRTARFLPISGDILRH
jgi:hypothetical protein